MTLMERWLATGIERGQALTSANRALQLCYSV